MTAEGQRRGDPVNAISMPSHSSQRAAEHPRPPSMTSSRYPVTTGGTTSGR